MTWTRDEALQEELVDPTLDLVPFWCAFCEVEHEREAEKDHVCPICGIGPMEAL